MAKTVLPSKFQEWKGLDRISKVVHEMHCIFRELSKDDFGIDGEIEVVVPKADGAGFAASGGIIKVQAKSGSSYVKRNNSESFTSPVSQGDLEYWFHLNFPVIYIVYHPDDDQLYWKEIRSYVRSSENVWQTPLAVAFDKAKDVFSVASFDRVCAIAQGSPERISLREQERLYSNLLPIRRLPRILTHAPTSFSNHEDADWIRSQIRGVTPPFRLVEGRLFTLTDLRNLQNPLRTFCDVSDIRDLPTDKWINDEARRRDFVNLINQLLGIHMRSCGLRYNRHFRRNYFPRMDEVSTTSTMRWNNVRTGWEGSRNVVKFYTYGGLNFWRHTAVSVSFQQIGSTWFLQVLPKYLFTKDGTEPYDNDQVGSLTTKLKSLEKNQHVLNHVLFWADVLARGKPAIEMTIGPRPLLVADKSPMAAIADFAIPYDPATYEASDPDAAVQMEMFGPPPGSDDEDGDEYWG